jgi:hypothetical protein
MQPTFYETVTSAKNVYSPISSFLSDTLTASQWTRHTGIATADPGSVRFRCWRA